MDFGVLTSRILEILEIAEILNFGALAIGNPIHFARPIMGDAKITPLNFCVLASRILEILQIAKKIFLWAMAIGNLIHSARSIMGQAKLPPPPPGLWHFGSQNL